MKESVKKSLVAAAFVAAITLPLFAICGAAIGIRASHDSERSLTPVGWCVEAVAGRIGTDPEGMPYTYSMVEGTREEDSAAYAITAYAAGAKSDWICHIECRTDDFWYRMATFGLSWENTPFRAEEVMSLTCKRV